MKATEITPLSQITITSRGIEFPENFTEEQWKETLTHLKHIHDGYHACLADTISFGRKTYGEEVVAAAMEQLEFPQADFNRATDISMIPMGMRKNSDGLTSEHFQVVGHEFPETEPEQERWLKIASDETLSPRELRRSIEAGQVTKDSPNKTGRGSGGLVTIENIMFGFKKWKDQVSEEIIVKKWSDSQKRAWLEETQGFADLREKVIESIT